MTPETKESIKIGNPVWVTNNICPDVGDYGIVRNISNEHIEIWIPYQDITTPVPIELFK